MYYTHPCSYCHKLFYVYDTDKYRAAATLYAGIKKHLQDYDEDHKEHDFDDGASVDTQEVASAMTESAEPPPGGYDLG
ncbi:MAG: hypothetical protein H0W89_02590 [Candidatus Levybacteria bacterium]|nr:hypothetical protein [Candidatus Levybacteria bacterium]